MTGKNRNTLRKTYPIANFPQKFPTDTYVIEPGPPRWEAET